jgi:hypothetical protein
MPGQRIALVCVMVIGLGLLGSVASVTQAEINGVPRTFLWHLGHLETMKQAWLAGDEALRPAIESLFKAASSALMRGPFSVMDKVHIPPSGDKHDYLELDPTYWPNPNTSDGLPWIDRGIFNPNNTIDGQTLERLGLDVEILTLAYFLSGDETYAQHAAFLLRTWFLDEATAMNPHMTYGKVNPNTQTGSFPIARATLKFMDIFNGAGLLEGSAAWSIADRQALQQWAAEFVRWMETHPFGLHEQQASNNHGTYYDLLNALLSIYSGQTLSLRSSLMRYQARMATQIAPDGSQPLEMERSSNLFYHTFNLSGALLLARLSEHVGDIDLLFYETASGGSLQKALAFLVPYATEAEAWPFFPNGERATKPQTQFRLYHLAASIYSDATYANISGLVPGNFDTDRVRIAYPITHVPLGE